MFGDSAIAANYSMSESNFRYVTTFGLGPYFAKKLLYDVKQSPAHALSFDESLNEEMQSKQLDVGQMKMAEWSPAISCRCSLATVEQMTSLITLKRQQKT